MPQTKHPIHINLLTLFDRRVSRFIAYHVLTLSQNKCTSYLSIEESNLFKFDKKIYTELLVFMICNKHHYIDTFPRLQSPNF